MSYVVIKMTNDSLRLICPFQNCTKIVYVLRNVELHDTYKRFH